MTPVRRLDAETVERIAAGEVITRPADAVRELVENALDAGTTRIEVSVEAGGIERIAVTDDGHGMSEADARLAVERHTTSKLDGDLDAVATLGFRGEALSSMASVARLSVTTKAGDAVAGTRVVVDDGTTVESVGHPVGTTVEVTDLFRTLPARRESLAGPAREFARISDVVSRYALAHPDVRFRLTHDGREVLSTPGSGADTDALLAVYDRTVAGQSAPVSHTDEDHDIHVEGRVCYPSVTRAKATHVYTAVNGRALAEPTVRGAVEAGYGSLLSGGRHPIAVVRVTVPPGTLDQNVHPAKQEVRFRDPAAVAAAVERAVADALAGEDLSARSEVSLGDLPRLDRETAETLADVRVIGAFRDLYLLCESGDDLLVVDQHAAHERVNYERLRAAAGDGIDSVPVDPPLTLSLSAREASTLAAHREAVASLGFALEPFGEGVYRVTGMPAPLGRVAGPESVRDVLDTFLAGEAPEDPRDALLADLACHPSFKAGETLTGEQAAALVADLGACDQPYACPHGRPTVLTIEEATLARSFGRPNTRLG